MNANQCSITVIDFFFFSGTLGVPCWMLLNFILKTHCRDFLGVPGLRLRTPNEAGLGWICGPRTRSHMPQLRICMSQLKPGAAK